MQPDCLKGQVVCGTVYGDMHFKDLLGSFARVGYCIPLLDFCLVLHGLCWQKSTIMELIINHHDIFSLTLLPLEVSTRWLWNFYQLFYEQDVYLGLEHLRTYHEVAPCSTVANDHSFFIATTLECHATGTRHDSLPPHIIQPIWLMSCYCVTQLRFYCNFELFLALLFYKNRRGIVTTC